MTSDLWGIPGTGKVPSPEKELKKLIDRATREAQAEIDKIATKVESDTKRSMARFARVTQRGINKSVSQAVNNLEAATKQTGNALEDATEEAVDKVLAAVAAGTVGELLNKLIDLAQAKLITKPVTIELFWFRFNVDVNDRIDALQKWAHVTRRRAPMTCPT